MKLSVGAIVLILIGVWFVLSGVVGFFGLLLRGYLRISPLAIETQPSMPITLICERIILDIFFLPFLAMQWIAISVGLSNNLINCFALATTLLIGLILMAIGYFIDSEEK